MSERNAAGLAMSRHLCLLNEKRAGAGAAAEFQRSKHVDKALKVTSLARGHACPDAGKPQKLPVQEVKTSPRDATFVVRRPEPAPGT